MGEHKASHEQAIAYCKPASHFQAILVCVTTAHKRLYIYHLTPLMHCLLHFVQLARSYLVMPNMTENRSMLEVEPQWRSKVHDSPAGMTVTIGRDIASLAITKRLVLNAVGHGVCWYRVGYLNTLPSCLTHPCIIITVLPHLILSHVTLCTKPSRFSTCNVEKSGSG